MGAGRGVGNILEAGDRTYGRGRSAREVECKAVMGGGPVQLLEGQDARRHMGQDELFAGQSMSVGGEGLEVEVPAYWLRRVALAQERLGAVGDVDEGGGPLRVTR